MRCLLVVGALSGLSAGTDDPVTAFRRADTALQDILSADTFPTPDLSVWEKHMDLYPEDRNNIMAAYASNYKTLLPVVQKMAGPEATPQGGFWSRLSEVLGSPVWKAYFKFRPAQDEILKRAVGRLRTSTWPLVERAYGKYQLALEEVRNADDVGEDVKGEVEELAKATADRYAAVWKKVEADNGRK